MMGKSTRKDEKMIHAVAERFKELRKAREISQELVQIDTGYNIGGLESGAYNITISTLSNLCKYYGVSIKEFFDGIEIE